MPFAGREVEAIKSGPKNWCLREYVGISDFEYYSSIIHDTIVLEIKEIYP